MKKVFKLALFILTASFVVGFSAQANEFFGGETPFPWGREIQFPWKTIEGNWNVDRYGAQPKFTFNVLYRHEDGVRVVHVSMYDEQGQLFAKGSGVADSDARKISAIMVTVNGDSFLLFVRAFKDTKACKDGQIMVVVTERSIDGPNKTKDNHYVIFKPFDTSTCPGN